MAKHYRDIWIAKNGPIPRDERGRSFEIHHINGNHLDDRLENLELLCIEKHFDAHMNRGEYAAAMMIAKRMDKTSAELSAIQRGSKHSVQTKLRISEAKKAKYASGETVPWNKGITHTDEVKAKMSQDRIGKRTSSTLQFSDVQKIRSIQLAHPAIQYEHSGGRVASYNWLLAKDLQVSQYQHLSAKCIHNILIRKSWNDC